MSKLSDEEYLDYMQSIIIPQFKPLLNKDIYSLIINRDFKFEICTDKTAKSSGCSSFEELIGISFTDYAKSEYFERFFKNAYNEETKKDIDEYVQKILKIQMYVFSKQKVISFIDLLPYDGKFISYLTTYTPVFHPNGEVIAIQSFAIVNRFLGFTEQFNNFEDIIGNTKKYVNNEKLTIREQEIGFLLCNGASQDQIAQFLCISRNTVAAILRNQLCRKFGIEGSNSKLLLAALYSAGIHRSVPESIQKPRVIILEEELADLEINP